MISRVQLRSYLEYGAWPLPSPSRTRILRGPSIANRLRSASFIRAKRPKTAITFGHWTHIRTCTYSLSIFPSFHAHEHANRQDTCLYWPFPSSAVEKEPKVGGQLAWRYTRHANALALPPVGASQTANFTVLFRMPTDAVSLRPISAPLFLLLALPIYQTCCKWFVALATSCAGMPGVLHFGGLGCSVLCQLVLHTRQGVGHSCFASPPPFFQRPFIPSTHQTSEIDGKLVSPTCKSAGCHISRGFGAQTHSISAWAVSRFCSWMRDSDYVLAQLLPHLRSIKIMFLPPRVSSILLARVYRSKR